MRLVWILAGLLLSSALSAQKFTVSVDSNSMLIGDMRTARLELSGIPQDAAIDSLDLQSWVENQVEPTSSSAWQKNGGTWQSAFRFMVFDTGYILLPPLDLSYYVAGDSFTIFSNDLGLEVYGITVDSTGLAPLREIRREGLKLSDVLPYIVGTLVILGILALWLVKRNRETDTKEIIIEVPDPPDEVALRQLSELDQKKLWQAGKIKEYQTELTYIIRWYLEEKFQFPALESTTTEIVGYLGESQVQPVDVGVVQEVLNMADLVKFAKATPAPTIHQDFMTKAEQFVMATRHYSITNSEEE